MRRLLRILPLLLVFAVMTGSSGCDEGLPEADFDLTPFLEMAQKAPCADRANRLFLIDGQMVFWDRRGQCADAHFSYTLFGSTPDDVLCTYADTIGGLMTSCPEAFNALFETLIANLEDERLGLGPEHTVEPIPF